MQSNNLPLRLTRSKNRNEIHSIENLLDVLYLLGEPKQGTTRFFRGHSKSSYLMQPSIYRQLYLIENEDKIIRDALTNCPDDFSPSDTLFEKLVKLQHYGYATRLLDLTTNALVALYFAASSQENEDGELIILDIPDEQIKYDDSDTVAVLSAISLTKKDLILENYIDFATKCAELTYHEYIYINNPDSQDSQKIKDTVLKKFNLPDWQTTLMLGADEVKQETFLKNFNEQQNIVSLIHNIRADKPSFRPVIQPTDMQRVLCVRAKLNNARISRQQGSFLLFGIDNEKVKPAHVPDEWLRRVDNQKIIIKNKKQIMKELKSFGISKQTLFPELESQAQEIMAQYKPK